MQARTLCPSPLSSLSHNLKNFSQAALLTQYYEQLRELKRRHGLAISADPNELPREYYEELAQLTQQQVLWCVRLCSVLVLLVRVHLYLRACVWWWLLAISAGPNELPREYYEELATAGIVLCVRLCSDVLVRVQLNVRTLVSSKGFLFMWEHTVAISAVFILIINNYSKCIYIIFSFFAAGTRQSDCHRTFAAVY